jgi:hypothetical protein
MKEKVKPNKLVIINQILNIICPFDNKYLVFLLLSTISIIIVIFLVLTHNIFHNNNSNINNDNLRNLRNLRSNNNLNENQYNYESKNQLQYNYDSNISINDYIKELFQLGVNNPKKLAYQLEIEDVLKVNFKNPKDFICPLKELETIMLIDFPDIVNHNNANKFKSMDLKVSDRKLLDTNNNRQNMYPWIFYQHLRKAGGTGFCDLAKNNMPRKMVPPYYCMPDDRGSFALPPWAPTKWGNKTYLIDYLHSKGFRIAANEWDAYYEEFGKLPGVILATTFRHPIDRWWSQYRFEHLEARDGSKKDTPRIPILKWYHSNVKWEMGINYYVKTFEGTSDKYPPSNKGDFYWTYHKYYNNKELQMTWPLFNKALNNIRKFDLILITEWLNTSESLIHNVLGWKNPPRQVLPHEVQAIRTEKKSIQSKEAISKEDYNIMLEENIFDLLFFHICKRIYLERLICNSNE